MSKWLRHAPLEPEDRALAAAADAYLLSADLMVSQPATSGGTAIDRLAKTRRDASPDEAAALAALRAARFRLLRLEGEPSGDETMARDVISNEELRVVSLAWPQLAAGMFLFGRVVILPDGRALIPGSVTPLDPAALAAARAHPSAGRSGDQAGARWAEAVYGHVVQYGTFDIPGLNRPREGFDLHDGPSDIDEILFDLVFTWEPLGASTPDPVLLERTRQATAVPRIVAALGTLLISRQIGEEGKARALERLLLVWLETVAARERSGSTSLSFDAISGAIARLDAEDPLTSSAAALFAELRRRVERGAGRRRGGDPALDSLVQRIQGLRAKTVAQGCTEQEALAAAEKVAELLERHGLSLSELEFRAQPCEGLGVQTTRRRLGPIDSCVPYIAAFFDCRNWVEQLKGATIRHVFFGLRGDVTAAEFLYAMVERAFEAETRRFQAGELYAEMAGERRAATNSFQIGLGRGIRDKLRAQRAARDARPGSLSGRDLVPVKAAMVDEELDRLGLQLRAREQRKKQTVLSDAFAAGEAAGQRFEVTSAIGRAA